MKYSNNQYRFQKHLSTMKFQNNIDSLYLVLIFLALLQSGMTIDPAKPPNNPPKPQSNPPEPPSNTPKPQSNPPEPSSNPPKPPSNPPEPPSNPPSNPPEAPSNPSKPPSKPPVSIPPNSRVASGHSFSDVWASSVYFNYSTVCQSNGITYTNTASYNTIDFYTTTITTPELFSLQISLTIPFTGMLGSGEQRSKVLLQFDGVNVYQQLIYKNTGVSADMKDRAFTGTMYQVAAGTHTITVLAKIDATQTGTLYIPYCDSTLIESQDPMIAAYLDLMGIITQS